MLSIKTRLSLTALREHYRVTHSFCFTSKSPALLHVNMGKQIVIFQGLKIAYLYRKEVCILEDSLCRVQKLNSSDLFDKFFCQYFQNM